MKHATEPPALEKPRQPGGIRAVILAVLVHAAFFGLIVFGVTWQNKPTPPVQAELWDKLPPVTKAPPAKSEPKADPPRPDPPKPPPKAQPKPPEPPKPAVKLEPAKPDPAIALKAEREKREIEKRERLEKQKADEKKKREQEELDKKKAEREEADKKKREEEAKQAAEKARAEAVNARQKDIDRFTDAIRAKIRGRANVPDTVTGSPEVHVRIRMLPGGEVLDITITKRSGNPAYDTAIERAIRSASPLPVPDARSELFPIFRDLNLQIRHER